MKENESDYIHAIVFRALDQDAEAHTLITLHLNRASALHYYDSERTTLRDTYHLPVVEHAGEKFLGVGGISQDSLRGTVYDTDPGRLYDEVARSIQSGKKCHEIVLDQNPGLNSLTAAIETITAQATYRYISLKPAQPPQAPPSTRKGRTAPTQSL